MNDTSATRDMVGKALRLPISATEGGCPTIKERAQSLRERVSIWRTICVASDAGADRAIQFAALHRETRARFLWGNDATIDDRHCLVLGHGATRSQYSVLQTVLACCRS